MLTGESVPHRSKVTQYLGPIGLSLGLGAGWSSRHRVGLRSANCLVDCRRNGETACPCKWPQPRDHSSYARVSSWRVSRQRLTPANCSSFPDRTDFNEVKALSARKACGRRRPYRMKSPEIVTLASSFLAICRRCRPIAQFEKFSRKLIFFSLESFSNPPSSSSP